MSAQVDMIPQTRVTLEGDQLARFLQMLERFDELDDVQEVYHNVDLPDEEEEE